MVELVTAAVVLSAVGWWASGRTRRRIEASRVLDRYARSRGLVYVPAREAAASPRVRGRFDDTDCVVDLYRLGGGIRTRISALAARQPGARLFVVQRRSDAAVAITAVDPPSTPRTPWSPGRVTSPRSFARPPPRSSGSTGATAGVRLRSEDGRVALSWRGIETDPLFVDAAAEIVAGIARTDAPDAPYR